MRRALRAALAAAALLAVVGCSGDDADEAAPEPTETAEPEPAPEPEPEPVLGEVQLTRDDVSSAVGLGLPAPDPASESAVNGFADDVATLLDDHLAAAADGSASPLVEAAQPGLLDEPDAELRVAALADAADPPASATYDISISAAAEPEWASVTVTTTSEGGTTADATLLFTPGDTGPTLVGVGEVEA